MDYDVWYLAKGSDRFREYMLVPLSNAGRNTTACVEWLVRTFIYSEENKYSVRESVIMFVPMSQWTSRSAHGARYACTG